MDDFGKLLTLALALLALATAAGFGLQRGRISSLRDQLSDSDKEIERIDRRREAAESELEAHKVRSDAKIAQLETDLAALSRVVTGEAHWVAIGHKLDEHHEQAETHWARDEQLLEEIRDRLPARSA